MGGSHQSYLVAHLRRNTQTGHLKQIYWPTVIIALKNTPPAQPMRVTIQQYDFDIVLYLATKHIANMGLKTSVSSWH